MFQFELIFMKGVRSVYFVVVVVCMWMSSCSSTIYWKDCPFSIELPLFLCQTLPMFFVLFSPIIFFLCSSDQIMSVYLFQGHWILLLSLPFCFYTHSVYILFQIFFSFRIFTLVLIFKLFFLCGDVLSFIMNKVFYTSLSIVMIDSCFKILVC